MLGAPRLFKIKYYESRRLIWGTRMHGVTVPCPGAGHSPGKNKTLFCEPPGPWPDLTKRM